VILREFEGERTIEAVVVSEEGGSGDVKYHLGATGVRATGAGDITVTLASNPSHLEAVDPVVEGRARAEQTDRSTREGYHDPAVALPILIHGDASFAGQGEVAETLNLEGLAGYSTGGTLHLIANNQVGFTTDPSDGRSTRYSSDLAKGFDIPIIHVTQTIPTQHSPRFGSRSPTAAASGTTSSSTSSATVATGTTSRTRPRTRSRCSRPRSRSTRPCESSTQSNSSRRGRLGRAGRGTRAGGRCATEERARGAEGTFGSAPQPMPDGRIPASTLDEVVTAVPPTSSAS